MAGEKGTCDTEKKVHDFIKKKGFLARMWSMLHTDDFEKRLQYISKEESAILLRMKKRSQRWRRISRDIIGFSVILEVVAVGYAITTTRVEDMDWKIRVLKFLPILLLPGVSSVVYSAFASFIKLCDRKDQRALERLRTERQAKIDQLKEKTNYYTTHQLIQRYDPDPAAKAAAATILASKLGSDSGLKVYLGDESELKVPATSSSDVEALQSTGLRNRRQGLMRSTSTGSSPLLQLDHERPKHAINEDGEAPEDNQLLVNTNLSSQGFRMNDGGWLARIAALLVGEDPMQSYALICGNCHMHNGLAHKEDFLYITYYCPHCQALNRPKHMEDNVSSSSSPKFDSGIVGGKADGTDELDWSHNVLTNNKPKRVEVNVTSSSRPPKPDSRIVGGKADATSKLDSCHDELTNKPKHLEENVSSSSTSSPKLDSTIVGGKANVTGEPDSSHNVLANRPKHPDESVSSSSSPKLDSAIIGGKADGTGEPDSSHNVLENRPKHLEANVSSSSSPKADSAIIGGKADGTGELDCIDSVLTNRSPVSPGSETEGVDKSETVSNPATSITEESSKDI